MNSLTLSKAFLLGLSFTFVYWLAFYDDGENLQKKIIQEQKTLQTLTTDIENKKKDIEALKTFQTAKAELGDRFEKLIKYIPKKFSTNEQMRILVREARSSGANIIEIKKSKTRGLRYKFYEELLVDVRLSGTFSQIVLFLSYLTKKDKVIILKKMELKAIIDKASALTEGAPSLEFSGQLAGFRQVEEKLEIKR